MIKKSRLKDRKASLKHALVPEIKVMQENNELHVTLDRRARAMKGTSTDSIAH